MSTLIRVIIGLFLGVSPVTLGLGALTGSFFLSALAVTFVRILWWLGTQGIWFGMVYFFGRRVVESLISQQSINALLTEAFSYFPIEFARFFGCVDVVTPLTLFVSYQLTLILYGLILRRV